MCCKYCYHSVRGPLPSDHTFNNSNITLLLLPPDCNILVIPSYSSLRREHFRSTGPTEHVDSLQCEHPWQRACKGRGQRSTNNQAKHEQTNREVQRSTPLGGTQYIPFKIKRRFERTCCLPLQGGRVCHGELCCHLPSFGDVSRRVEAQEVTGA
jgi:hypothetical protein